MTQEKPDSHDSNLESILLQTTEFTISSEDTGTRIDQFLTAQQTEVSRSQLKKWIEQKYITVNELPVSPSYKLRLEDRVLVHTPEVAHSPLQPEDITLNILYEDSEIVVVNKPAGMVVHPAVGHSSGTLVNALLHHCKDLTGIGGVERPGIVHRLDKDTSGVIVVAKNELALNHIAAQFKVRTIKKTYLALAKGRFKEYEGDITTTIGRHKRNRKKMVADEAGGRPSETSWQVIHQYDRFAYVRLFPRTGRTHQIRVHLSSINHPILGDDLYGGKALTHTEKFLRCALHARRLELKHPTTGKQMRFEAPLAPDIQDFLNRHNQGTPLPNSRE
jgi:23S rRNA pseudouridine1911/1915/1917 synthase